MRSIYWVFLLLLVFVACNTNSDDRIKGEWELIEFGLSGAGGNPVSNEETLRNAGAVWDIKFSGNGKFIQSFNMRTPEMKMEVEEGTWETTNDSLIIKLQIDTFETRMAYTYEILGDTLSLTLAPEGRPTRVKTKFRKK